MSSESNHVPLISASAKLTRAAYEETALHEMTVLTELTELNAGLFTIGGNIEQ